MFRGPCERGDLAEIWTQKRTGRTENRRVGEIDELGSELKPSLSVDWKVLLEAEISGAKTRSSNGAIAASPKGPRHWCVIGRGIKPLETAIRGIMAGTKNAAGTIAISPRTSRASSRCIASKYRHWETTTQLQSARSFASFPLPN